MSLSDKYRTLPQLRKDEDCASQVRFGTIGELLFIPEIERNLVRIGNLCHLNRRVRKDLADVFCFNYCPLPLTDEFDSEKTIFVHYKNGFFIQESDLLSVFPSTLTIQIHSGPKEGIVEMCTYSKMLTAFGCVVLTASSSFAELPWNPLNLIRDSKIESAAKREISVETRRAIVQESQFYPPAQSKMLLESFESLSDGEAREKLKFYKANRINNLSGQSSMGRPKTASGGNSRVGAGQTSMRSSAPPRQISRGTADLGSQSPWDRGQSQQSSKTRSEGMRYAGMQQPNASRRQSIIPSSYGQAPSTMNRKPSVQEDSDSYVTPGNPFLPTSYMGFNPATASRTHQVVVRPARDSSEEVKGISANYRPVAENLDHQVSQSPVTQSTTFGRANQSPQAGLAQLIEQSEAAVKASHPGQSEQEYQAHITRHVELRMLYLLAGQRDRAIAAIPEIQPNEQAFWTRMFWSLSNYLDEQNYPDKSDRTAAALSQMRAAILSLQGNAHLAIDRATFCTDIESFGNYTRFEKDEFTPGQEVLVYAELENFQSERTTDGKYRTLLKSSVRLVQDGRVIDEVQYNATEDLSHSRRQDFMQGFRYQLPQRLTPGNYSLQLTIEDQLSSKSAEYSLNLKVR